MKYSVFVDLSRHLASGERSAVFEALEARVPDSGCVGVDKGPNDEVYFCVEAGSEKEASEKARRYMSIVIQEAGLNVECTITFQQ